jgi:hypothetical protein
MVGRRGYAPLKHFYAEMASTEIGEDRTKVEYTYMGVYIMSSAVLFSDKPFCHVGIDSFALRSDSPTTWCTRIIWRMVNYLQI